MVENGFNKLFWGFFFILIDFKIQGFDILPDIIGYILFAVGFSALTAYSGFFVKAGTFNIPMIIFSIFSIYEKPNQGSGIQLGFLGPFGIILSIASMIIGLLVIYNLFMGVKEMAEKQEQTDLYDEADKRWNQYLILQIAIIFSFIFVFIPVLGAIYVISLLIASVVMSIIIMKFMKVCSQNLKDIE